MPVDFIFKLIFNPSGGNNNGLAHHKGEEACKQRTAYNDGNVDQNLFVEAEINIFCKFVYRFSYKLNFIYIEEITGNDK